MDHTKTEHMLHHHRRGTMLRGIYPRRQAEGRSEVADCAMTARAALAVYSRSPQLAGRQAAERELIAFLRSDSGDPLKKECVLPMLIDRLMHTDGLQVEVLHTDAVWFGVTYLADKEYVEGVLRSLHEAGVYPALV